MEVAGIGVDGAVPLAAAPLRAAERALLHFGFSCAIGGATPDEPWGRVWPYLVALLLAVVLIAAVPWLSIRFL